MKKILNLTVFAITLLFTSSLIYGQNDLLDQTQKLIKENDTLSIEMKKSNSGFISLDSELENLNTFFRKNKNKPEMQDSIEKRILNFNNKLSNGLQKRTDIIYKYNSNRISTVRLIKKINDLDSVKIRLNEAYENLEIYSDFLDSEFKSFIRFETRIDPIKSRFALIEKRYAKRQ